MPNYAFITMTARIAAARAGELLREAMGASLDPRWTVRLTDGVWDGPTWFVHLPGTSKQGRAAAEADLPHGEDVGFIVVLDTAGSRFAFPHNGNCFERWAQGCLEEQLAEAIGVGVLYDATNEIRPPGARQHRSGKTFREHLASRFTKPLTADDEAFLDRQMYSVPEGH